MKLVEASDSNLARMEKLRLLEKHSYRVWRLDAHLPTFRETSAHHSRVQTFRQWGPTLLFNDLLMDLCIRWWHDVINRFPQWQHLKQNSHSKRECIITNHSFKIWVVLPKVLAVAPWQHGGFCFYQSRHTIGCHPSNRCDISSRQSPNDCPTSTTFSEHYYHKGNRKSLDKI